MIDRAIVEVSCTPVEVVITQEHFCSQDLACSDDCFYLSIACAAGTVDPSYAFRRCQIAKQPLNQPSHRDLATAEHVNFDVREWHDPMNDSTLELLITVGIIIGVGGLLALFFTLLSRQLETTGRERMQARFPTQQILRSEMTANFFGLESRGRGQIRGNGVLVLTPEELWFSQFAPRGNISIPLPQIMQVRLVNAHLGKRILGRKLLYVRFQTPEGTDAAAWVVEDAEGWQAAIRVAQAY
ncbi:MULTISPECIES: hypothetical protein [unclassified Leptolyngbya]|uniref:hypothetical protein n=1 Tax=unclassified Leptolyngbya TaxID=2650499 RepID=UPI001683DB5B|nr:MULTISPECIES: hypothetical protein [unclassified Leptolyngbya]MBD1913207.1 hypothetical protein [Leptolyngbya sp. FACHB-8]MBD2154930.1 hypothetical protein [Leptolyngbya sp. FACHB-16]